MAIAGGNGPDFDDLLEKELHRRVGSLSGPSSPASAAMYHSAFLKGGTMTFLSSITARASSKAAAGPAVAALAIGGASAAAAAATGSPNPAIWGKTVTAAVATCKDQLKNGAHGIGKCVSDVAKHKGAEERAEQAGDADKHPQSASNSTNGNASGSAGNHGAGRPEISSSPKVEGKSDQSHGQGASHRSEKSPGPPTEGKSDNHPTPRP